MRSNQRNEKREKSFIPVSFKNIHGYVTDISPTGCQMFLEDLALQVEENEQISLHLEIPEYTENRKLASTTLKGEVSWKKNREKFLTLGIRFNEMDEENTRKIQKIVHYWGFLNSTFGNQP